MWYWVKNPNGSMSYYYLIERSISKIVVILVRRARDSVLQQLLYGSYLIFDSVIVC